MEYEVRWVTQVDADSPEEAAKHAAEMQRDPTTLAIVFEVIEAKYADDEIAHWTTIEVPWPEDIPDAHDPNERETEIE